MNFNFIEKRLTFYSFAILSSLIAILAVFFLPMNLWIDMTWWVQIEYNYTNSVDVKNQFNNLIDEVKNEVKIDWKDTINNVVIYKVAWENKFVIEAWLNKLSELAVGNKLEETKTAFKDKLTKKLSAINSSKITFAKYVSIWESFGDYIKQTAYWTILATIIMISLYIAWAYSGSIEWYSSFPFAAVTMITLAHDVLAALGFYLITSFFFPEFKVDTFFITAMLTVLGYSISDTIVIMDRIRTNLKNKLTNKIDFGALINNSVNETLTRSLLTSFTVFITLLAMFFFWPVAIKWFILAMIFGTIFGTYSSIAIAAPLLYDISGKK